MAGRFLQSPSSATAPLETSECTVEEFRQRMRDRPDTTFAILDACDEPRVLEKVEELGPRRAVSLYRGWAESEYRDIAPYLVQVDESLLEWIVGHLWDDPWGVFVVAHVKLSELRRHLRRFLTVRDPDGAELYFRFYDPRVLATFFAHCTQTEAIEFLGPIRACAASAGPDTLTLFHSRPLVP